MDFIFEEDMDEVGSDIEAYCPKCKADTAHTVITKYEEEVRRVQCSPCGDVHAYRKPRGEVEEEIPEPVAAKKRAQTKKPSWQEAIDKAGHKQVSHARPYTIRDHYHEGDIVSHPKFGVGFVTEISENKAEVTFQDERRVLVHNRPDLAAQMPAIAPVPAPREEKVKGKRGGKKGAEAPAPPPAAAHAGKSVPPAAAVAGKKGAPAPVAAPAPPPSAKDLKKSAALKKAAPAPPPPPPPPAAKKAAPPVVVQGKAARAQAAAKKKTEAKGKPTAKPAAKPVAKPAARPAPKPAATRSVRPAARTARAEPKKKKAGKAW